MTQEQIRLGVDVGGTFTDVAVEVSGTLHSTKVLTNYSAPEVAIGEAIDAVCTGAGIATSQLSTIIHGTTLATNALIERRGAKTALITTKGFRDVIEMRTESRFEQYDLNLKLPEALIAREHRLVLNERIDARGEVLVALEREEVEALVDRVIAAGYESVAVGLIHFVSARHKDGVGPGRQSFERDSFRIAEAVEDEESHSEQSQHQEGIGEEGIDAEEKHAHVAYVFLHLLLLQTVDLLQRLAEGVLFLVKGW